VFNRESRGQARHAKFQTREVKVRNAVPSFGFLLELAHCQFVPFELISNLPG
jgi:hypothetical protein